MTKTVVFDLETQKIAQEVGGWHNKREMKISVGVTYCLESKEYKVFLEDQIHLLVKELLECDRIVSYNGIRFDVPVLEYYASEDEFQALQEKDHFDILQKFRKYHEFRVGLDSMMKATFDEVMESDGLDAIHWYRSGEWFKLIEYCKKDVRCTAQLYEHALKGEPLYYTSKLSGKTAWKVPRHEFEARQAMH